MEEKKKCFHCDMFLETPTYNLCQLKDRIINFDDDACEEFVE